MIKPDLWQQQYCKAIIPLKIFLTTYVTDGNGLLEWEGEPYIDKVAAGKQVREHYCAINFHNDGIIEYRAN